MTYGLNKQRGLADWAFIAIIVGAVSLIGTFIPTVTKRADTVPEQMAEQFIKMQTGQEVDFSAHLKKLPDGSVVATDAKAHTTRLPALNQAYIYDSNVDTKLGTHYDK